MGKEAKIPRSKRITALVMEVLAIPGSGLFCLGRKRLATLHLLAALTSLALLIVAALGDTPALLWLCATLAVSRPLAGAVQCLRSSGDEPTWKMLGGVGLVGFILAQAPAEFIGEHWVEVFKIPSESMVPTVLVGDHIFVDKRATAKPGDLVVYRSGPEHQSYMKRVIAVGPAKVRVVGRRVFIDNKVLQLSQSAQGCPLPEPCETKSESLGGVQYPVVFRDFSEGSNETYEEFVDLDEVYVMGDNRDASHDSRHHGPVPLSDVAGVMTVIWWRGKRRTE